jgi:hypothetical protein
VGTTDRTIDDEARCARDLSVEVAEGTLRRGEQLSIVAESDLVIFGDGIESDAVPLTWGQRVALTVASRRLRLLV